MHYIFQNYIVITDALMCSTLQLVNVVSLLHIVNLLGGF